MVLTAHATTKQYLVVVVFQTDFFHHLCDEAKVLPERLQDPAEKEDVVEAGEGDQQEVEGVAHVWKRCEKDINLGRRSAETVTLAFDFIAAIKTEEEDNYRREVNNLPASPPSHGYYVSMAGLPTTALYTNQCETQVAPIDRTVSNAIITLPSPPHPRSGEKNRLYGYTVYIRKCPNVLFLRSMCDRGAWRGSEDQSCRQHLGRHPYCRDILRARSGTYFLCSDSATNDVGGARFAHQQKK